MRAAYLLHPLAAFGFVCLVYLSHRALSAWWAERRRRRSARRARR